MKYISYSVDDEGHLDITVPPSMSKEFKILVTRACSTWQDISPDMKHFADRVLGVDKIVGDNMKLGFEKEYVRPQSPQPATVSVPLLRSCCFTTLREPHLASCSELTTKVNCSKCHIYPCHCSFIG